MDYSQIIVRVSYEDKNYEIIIAAQDSLEQLRHQIKSVLETNNIFSNVNENSFRMRVGFPPVIIDSQTPGEKTLKELKIGNNDQIRLEHVDENVDKASIPSNAGNSKDSNDLIDYTKYSIKRKVIPADNSCLFNSVNYALNQNINEPFIMRSLIAAEIQSNLDLYNEAILDKNPNEYCEWIMDSSTWGGGIEISILSKSFQVAVAVVDILNCTIECFGEVK
jgi:ubiquitin thioesterase OTU1